jgi:CP family cyanate transporter-like MFS transporter
MAQSIGYLLAATGPVLAGTLTEQTHTWHTALITFACLSAVQILLGATAGRPRPRPRPT